MPNTYDYLNKTGLSYTLSKLKTYIDSQSGGSNTGTFIVDTNGMSVGDSVRVRSEFDITQTEDKQVVTVGVPLIFTVPSRDYYKVCTLNGNNTNLKIEGTSGAGYMSVSYEESGMWAVINVYDSQSGGPDTYYRGKGIYVHTDPSDSSKWLLDADTLPVAYNNRIYKPGTTVLKWTKSTTIDISFKSLAEVSGAYYTVDDGQTHYVNNIFDKTTLRGIQAILNSHQESNMLAVGDEVTVKINGVDETYIILAMNVYASHEVIFGWKYVSETLSATPTNYSSRANVNTYCDNILANMTSEDRALIKNKTVNYSHSGNMAYIDRKIWLPTRFEVFGDQSNEGASNTQLTYFVTQANRIRSQKGGSATEWQLATSNADGNKVITTSNAGSTSTSSSARAILPCFHLTADM